MVMGRQRGGQGYPLNTPFTGDSLARAQLALLECMTDLDVPVRVPQTEREPTGRLPVLALAALAAMGFVLLAAETMPAGLLPEIAAGLRTSEAVVGQFISVWALGTVIVTIPAISLTRGFRRKPLLLTAIAGLLVMNTVTALSDVVAISLASRLLGGAFTGIIWGMLAAYGRRISPPEFAGRSLAIVSLGAPLGFAFGTPLGAWLGSTFGWAWAFVGLTVIGLIVFVLIIVVVPDAPGQAATGRLPVRRIFALPGIVVILAVITAWMLGHNTIFTYIAPYLRAGGSGMAPEAALLVYGIASLVGMGVVAVFIDRYPRALLALSLIFFVGSAVILLLGGGSAVAVTIGSALWGLTFGGAAAQLQSALSTAGGENSDVANSFLPVAFNLAIFLAGAAGALVLGIDDAVVLPIVMIAGGVLAMGIAFAGRKTAFRRPSVS